MVSFKLNWDHFIFLSFIRSRRVGASCEEEAQTVGTRQHSNQNYSKPSLGLQAKILLLLGFFFFLKRLSEKMIMGEICL